MPKIVCLWPGLPQLWLRGAWSGLALAFGAALLLNFVLTASLVWTDWLGGGLLKTGWIALVALWGICAWVSFSQGYTPPVVTVEIPTTPEPVEEDLFREVYGQYLQGNWFEAETLLNSMVGRNPRDAESLLLLATLRRHTGRLDEAETTLERLLRLDEAARWRQEIKREQWLIGEARFEQEAEQELEQERQAATAEVAKCGPAGESTYESVGETSPGQHAEEIEAASSGESQGDPQELSDAA